MLSIKDLESTYINVILCLLFHDNFYVNNSTSLENMFTKAGSLERWLSYFVVLRKIFNNHTDFFVVMQIVKLGYRTTDLLGMTLKVEPGPHLGHFPCRSALCPWHRFSIELLHHLSSQVASDQQLIYF